MTTGSIDPWAELLEQFNGGKTPSIDRVKDALGFSYRQLRQPGFLRELFMVLPIDSKSFRDQYPSIETGRHAEADASRSVLLRTLVDWFEQAKDSDLNEGDRLIVGIVGFLALTLQGLEESERLGTVSPALNGEYPEGPCHVGCGIVLGSPATRTVIDLVYGSQADDDTDTDIDWRGLDLESMRFYRHGSTSMIVLVQRKNDRTILALKLVLAPFLRMPEIRNATKSYKKRYAIPHSTTTPEDYAHLIDVYASTDSWILMSFIPGKTLADRIALRNNSISDEEVDEDTSLRPKKFGKRSASAGPRSQDPVRLTDMKKVGEAVWRALEQNWKASALAGQMGLGRPKAHGDLSPSNIIVREGFDCVLIDYGPNYLYTKTVRGAGSLESVYIAPEVRSNEPDTDLADIFSLGQILILAGGMTPNPRGTVPDELYMWHPNVARLLEDYLDADPRRRLACSGRSAGMDIVTEASRWRAQFNFELDMAIELQENPGLVATTLPDLVLEQRLWNGEPGRNRRLLRAVDNWSRAERQKDWFASSRTAHYVDAQRRAARWLFGWSVAVACMTGYSALTVSWWLLRDLGVSWGPNWLIPLQYIFLGGADGFPGVDAFRMADYDVPDLRHNWPARVVALSYALVAAKVYQSVYSRVAPIRARGTLGLSVWPTLAEIWMRGMPILNTVLVLWVTIVGVDWWPLATIIGQTLLVAGNISVMCFIRRSLSKAREPQMSASGDLVPTVSTVPASDTEITGLDLIGSWVPSSILFAIICWVVGTLLYLDDLSDVGLYASMVAFLNIFLIYAVKCGLSGAKMRVACHRASFAAERLSLSDPSLATRGGTAGSGVAPSSTRVGEESVMAARTP